MHTHSKLDSWIGNRMEKRLSSSPCAPSKPPAMQDVSWKCHYEEADGRDQKSCTLKYTEHCRAGNWKSSTNAYHEKDNRVTNLLPACVNFQEGPLIWMTNTVETASKRLS